jgi:polysaccharide deacetylase family protein (PEP-CTERM system associated)
MKNIFNFLTFDIEEWYHANYDGIDFSSYTDQQTSLEANVDRLIDLCAKFNIKSTCFVLGSVAEKKPQIVKKLYQSGHEISSHGYGHQLVYKMTKDEFKNDLKKSCDILENITGEKVSGFRAPSWSVKIENLEWYYDTIEELGLKYSSSVYPAYTFLYGIPGFPDEIHYPEVNGRKVEILEFPVPVVNILGNKLGFSGGFYLRFFPVWFIKKKFRNNNEAGNPVFLYLHPREIDVYQPRLKLPVLEYLIQYWGISKCSEKLLSVLMKHSNSIIRMKDYHNFLRYS